MLGLPANATRFLIVLAVLGMGSAAFADGKPATADVDISKLREKLVILHDGSGHYLAIVPYGKPKQLFYAHGKKAPFHRQRVYSSGHTEGVRMSRSFWSPFVRGTSTLSMERGKWEMRCGDGKTPLSEVSDEERDAILATAKFKEPLWNREAYALARDDRGVYYYVDRLREEGAGRGFRLFKGRKARMKPQKMVDVVHDSEGDIFATKSGDLRMILGKGEATWVQQNRKGEDRKVLTIVPVRRNAYLIYTELGVYNTRFGTPCDDM